MICDVPAVVAAGRNLARECDAPHLDFTTEFADADGSDVLLTCGTLQYLPDDLAALLRPLRRRPRHVLVNRVPFSEQPTYYSVQNIGPTSCAYRIAEGRQFVDAMAGLGYETVDTWSCPESWFTVRRRPSLTVPSYTGYYLRIRADENGHG
jgi:putative methyltransferase (TIGR04325 family)